MVPRLLVIGALVLGWVGVIPAWIAWTVAAGAAVVIVADLVLTLWEARRTVPSGAPALVGKTAIARSPLAPQGFVFVDGERWQAEMEADHAAEGERVVVVGGNGLRLLVRRLPTEPGPVRP